MDINLLKYLTNYGDYKIKVKSFSSVYDPSYDVSVDFSFNGAVIKIVSNRYLKIVKNIEGSYNFKLYVDEAEIGTFTYSSENTNFSLDLTEYEIEEGKRKITISAYGDDINDNLSNTVYYYCGGSPIYGISGLDLEESSLTRTDDAIDLGFSIDSSTGEVTSDFNNIFPFSEAEVVTLDAGKFLHMPDMYFRIGTNSDNVITDIAVSEFPSDTGSWYFMPSFYYACYGGYVENSKMYSKSGVSRSVNTTRASFRTYAKNQGEEYQQLDLYHYIPMVFLFWIEFATKDSDSIMTGVYNGSGTSSVTTLVKCGTTDSLSTPSGYDLSTGQMRYHYIEDFYGNTVEFLDGIISQSLGSYEYVTNDSASFSDSDTSNYNKLSYKNPTTSYTNPQIKYISWDSSNPFMVLPSETIDNSNYDTYFCKKSSNYGNVCVYTGISHTWASKDKGGLYSLSRCSSNTAYSDAGSRLIKI